MAKTATPRARKTAIERTREKYAADPHAPFEYEDLPEPVDAAFTFYCVYLGYADGVNLRGPHPAFLRQGKQTIVSSETDPFIDPGFTLATNAQQQAILENMRPNLAKDDQGRPIQFPARYWQYVADKNQRFYEDPRVAAKSASPFVRKIALYCPVKDSGQSGALEDHGPYLGVNAMVPDDHDGELGQCERCAGDPSRQQRALRVIADLCENAKVPLGAELAQRVMNVGQSTLITTGQ